jgi:cytochrome c oxidase subunit 2
VRWGSIVRIALVGALVGLLVTLVAVLIHWLPDPASEQMERIEFVYWFATIICIVIFALVGGVILYSVVRFRAAPDDDNDGPPIHGHTGLEIAWTAVPALLVTAIAIVSAIVLARNDDVGKNPLKVDVTAVQFAWKFAYPGHRNATSGVLVLPLGRPVELTLRANDVIHSFWVPNFGQKQDAVPGITTRLVITPNKLGTYTIICTELYGLGHAAMRSTARVVSPAQFAAWVKRQQPSGGGAGGGGGGSGGGGGGGGGNEGASLFTDQGCGGCHEYKRAGSDARIGPSLDNLAADAQKAGKPLADYVHESIRDPGAYVVPGYQNGVMPTFSSLSDEQVDALVQYLTEAKGGAKQ